MRPVVKVEGARELRRALNRAADADLKREMKAANRAAAEVVARQGRVEAPKKTGRLAGSIRATAGVASGSVRAGRAAIPYAGVIHFGWPARNIEPQPFLYEAADRRLGEVVSIYQARVRAIAEAVEAST